ncbi:hypothetical protein D3C73_1219830 [compost metagenome]
MLVRDKFLILQLGQLQDITGQRGELPGALNDQAAVFLAFCGRELMILHQDSIAFNRCDRRLEFMGDIGDKIAPQRLNPAQLLHHAVEIDRHLLKHLHPVFFMPDPDAEIPLGHLLRGFADIMDRSQQLPAKKSGHRRTDQKTGNQHYSNRPEDVMP